MIHHPPLPTTKDKVNYAKTFIQSDTIINNLKWRTLMETCGRGVMIYIICYGTHTTPKLKERNFHSK